VREVIEYYNKTSSGYDELYGEEQMEKFNFIKDRIKGKTILDIGCGTGKITSIIPGFVVGVDISKEMIKQYNGRKVVASATNLPFRDKSFDLVFSLTVVQDIKNQEQAISEFKRVGRHVLFSVLNKSFSLNLPEFKKIIGKKDLFYEF